MLQGSQHHQEVAGGGEKQFKAISLRESKYPLHRQQPIRLLALLVLWLAFALMVSSALRKSATVDEQSHLFRGVAYLKSGATQFLLGHPILGGALSALPLLSEPNLRLPVDDPAWEEGNWSVGGDKFLWQLNERPLRLIFLGRLPVIWLTLLLGALVYRWGREWAGPVAGFLAFVLLLLDPNVLANGRLITGDLPLVLFYVLALYGYWRWVKEYRRIARRAESQPALLLPRHRSAGYLLLSGLGLGLAAATKFNAALLLPILGLWALILAWRRGDIRPLLALLVVGFCAWFIIWAVYGFSLWRGFFPGGAFWEDLFWQSRYLYSQHGVYLFGESSPTGWWYYFPVTFILKTPLITLVLFVLATWLAIRHRSRQVWLFLLLPLLIYFIGSMISALNIGYRYLLPVLPLIFLLVGVELGRTSRISQKPGKYILLLTALYVLLALWVWPDYLAYFNVLAGRDSWRSLSDSNVDWGQDLPALAAWQQANQEPLKLSYFGTAHPSAYGLSFEPLPTWSPGPEQLPPSLQSYNPADPAPGAYALSVTNLHGVVLGQEREAYATFREQTPTDRIGGSIFVYHVPARGAPADVAFSGLRPADLAPALHDKLNTNDVRVRWIDGATTFIWPAEGGWLVTTTSQKPTNPPLAALWPDEPIATVGEQELYRLPAPPELFGAEEQVDFGGIFSFLGQQVVGEAGDTISLLTAWRAQQPGDRPIKIFVHLLDADGNILGQWDGLDVAPDKLLPGDLFIQSHELDSAEWAEAVTLSIGLYDGSSLERLGEPVSYPLSNR